MQSSSELYEKVLSHSQNLIYVLNREGKFILVSRAGAKAMGFTPQEMVGKTWQDLRFPLDVMAPFEIKMRTVFASGAEGSGELLFPTTGGISYFSYHIAPLHNDEGIIDGVVVTFSDVTERRRVEIDLQAMDRLMAVLVSSIDLDGLLNGTIGLLKDIMRADAAVILLREGDVVRARAAIGTEEDVDAAFSIKIGEGFAGTIIKTAQPMHIDNAWESPLVERSVITKVGIRQMVGVPLLDKRTAIGVLHIDWFAVHRITEREMNLLLMAAERCALAIVNAQLHEEATEAKERAELYIDLLTHDINNLNAAVRGYVHLVLDRGKLEEKERGQLVKTLDLLDNSSHLIEDVEKIQRLETQGNGLGPIDLDQILDEVIHSARTSTREEVTINFRPQSGRMVMASDLLRDVFINLIINAVKHSEGEVAIDIRIDKMEKERREYYRVVIEDNGPGIPDELKNKLLSRLQRGNTKAPGRGLGLYLVKRLVEDFSGEVLVEDRVPEDHSKGARFVVLLPRAP